MLFCKFLQIRVQNRDLFSSWVLKVFNLGRVEARYWKPKIVFRQIPARFELAHLIGLRACIYKSAKVEAQIVKTRILKFRFKYYLSRVITLDSARYSYPSKSRIPSFFRVAKRGWVSHRNLAFRTQTSMYYLKNLSWPKSSWPASYGNLVTYIDRVPSFQP